MTTYQEAIRLITESEEGGRVGELSVGNDALEKAQEVKKQAYGDVLDDVEKAEGIRVRVKPEAAKEKQQAEIQPQVAYAGKEKEAQKPAPGIKRVIRNEEYRKETEKAAGKLEQRFRNIGEEFEGNIEKFSEKVNTSGLVLPKLSLQDQINDLQKISEGLDENAFGEDELNVINDEIAGLLKIMQKKTNAPQDQVNARNQLLMAVALQLGIAQ